MSEYVFDDIFNSDEVILIRRAVQYYHDAVDQLLETEVDERVALFGRKFITENILRKLWNINEVYNNEE